MVHAALFLCGHLAVPSPSRLSLSFVEERWTARVEGPLAELFDPAVLDAARAAGTPVPCALALGGCLVHGAIALSELVQSGRDLRVSFTPTSID